MLLSDFISEGSKALECIYAPAEARALVLRLCEDVIGTKSYTHIIDPGYEVEDARSEELRRALARLCAGEPIQHLEGFSEFCGLRLNVTPDVLIPRPETEELVRAAVERVSHIQASRPGQSVRVLDLCSGSGCIAWAIAALAPGAEVVAVDVSEAALAVARSQEVASEKAPLFVLADILDTGQAFDHGTFDIVLSNPPYIMESERAAMRRNVLDYEPHLALFVPDDDPLVFYRAVARWSERFLRPGGWGMVEINETLPDRTAAVFRDAGFVSVGTVSDFFKKSRFVSFEKSAL